MPMPQSPPSFAGHRPRLAVHKFSSCDGCQLALLNAGEELLALAELCDIVHFAEAGVVDTAAEADLALVEGSISTPEEAERIRGVRQRSRYLIAIGACATAGGPQALRNFADTDAWIADAYPDPEHIAALPRATPVAGQVPVDFELRGCPVNSRQVLDAVRDLLAGAAPRGAYETVCAECKRQGHVCVLVTRGVPCLGPVTASGCGALCPGIGRDCYGCYGPAENANTGSLSAWFAARGLEPAAVARRYLYQNSGAPAFHAAAIRWQERVRDEG
jgi:coenzyme F420-reducing hydrogenase gamma subunit